MKRSLYTVGALCLGLAVAPVTRGATVSLTPTNDAMIFGTSAGVDTTKASGQGPALFAGADGSLNKKRSLLAFDLSSIPSNATVTGATLTLYLGMVAGSAGNTAPVQNAFDRQIGLYVMLQSWAEGSSGTGSGSNIGGTGQGFTRAPGDVTWDYARWDSDSSKAVLWGATGSPVHGGNFSSTESGLLDVPVDSMLINGAAFTWSSAGMVSDVQGWVDGTLDNNGWMLKSDNNESRGQSFLGFWSKDGALAGGNSGLTPTLWVTYTVPVPEPASVVCLLAAAPMLLGRRRRVV